MDDLEESQPLVSHLIELRTRLLKSLGVILMVFLCLFYFANDIYSLIAAPLIEQLSTESTMIATEVASPFMAPFKRESLRILSNKVSVTSAHKAFCACKERLT